MTAPVTPRRGRFWLVAAAAALVAAILAFWGVSELSSARAEANRQARVAELETAIRTALPTGSTPAQVLAFLDARHIHHSGFDERTRAIYASTAEEQVNLLLRTGVYLVFHFDSSARTTDFSVEQKATGL